MAKKLGTRSPFFRFVLALAKEDLRKSIQFLQLNANIAAVFDQPKAKYAIRDRVIKSAQSKLIPGAESVAQFLNTVTNSAVKASVMDENILDLENDEEEDMDENLKCKQCMINRRQVLYSGCHHLLLCLNCFKNIEKAQGSGKVVCGECFKTVINSF